MADKEVLQKFIACNSPFSRRRAEDLIKQGKVKVNAQAAFLGQRVGAGDKVSVGGKELRPVKTKIYIKLNKPREYVCTNRRFEGEKNIFDLVGAGQGLFAAGRLDKNSRGLVLLTNDGELTQKLTHPKFGHEKIYTAEARGGASPPAITAGFKRGVDIGDGDGIARAKDVIYLGKNKYKIILAEGKKRQIRRMFKVFRCAVEDLLRIEIAGLKLGNLKEGEWKHLSKKEVDLLKNQC